MTTTSDVHMIPIDIRDMGKYTALKEKLEEIFK